MIDGLPMHKLSFICASDLTISQKIMINQIKHDFIGKKKISNPFQLKIKSFDNLYPRTCISKCPAWFYNNIFVKSLSISLYCKKQSPPCSNDIFEVGHWFHKKLQNCTQKTGQNRKPAADIDQNRKPHAKPLFVSSCLNYENS